MSTTPNAPDGKLYGHTPQPPSRGLAQCPGIQPDMGTANGVEAMTPEELQRAAAAGRGGVYAPYPPMNSYAGGYGYQGGYGYNTGYGYGANYGLEIALGNPGYGEWRPEPPRRIEIEIGGGHPGRFRR